MVDIRWDLLRPVDVGGQFQQGFQTAQQNALVQRENAFRQEERERASTLRNALTGAINPQTGAVDPVIARQAYLGAGDPQGAMQFDAQRGQQQAAALDQHRERINFGAGLIEQLRPQDDAGWQQVLAAMAQAGHDISDVPAAFDPNYAQNVVAISRASRPAQQQAPPNIQREVDYYRDIGRPDLAEQLLTRHAEGPPLAIRDPETGQIEVIPQSVIRRQAGQAGPAAPPPVPRQGEIIAGRRYLGPPASGPDDPVLRNPANWGPREGGAGQQGPRTFP